MKGTGSGGGVRDSVLSAFKIHSPMISSQTVKKLTFAKKINQET